MSLLLNFFYSWSVLTHGNKWVTLYLGVRAIEALWARMLFFFKLLNRRFPYLAELYNLFQIFWLPLQYILMYTILFSEFGN